MSLPHLSVLLLLWLAAGCAIEHRPRTDTAGSSSAPSSTAACGVDRDSVVSGTGLGHLRIGRLWSEIPASCRVIGGRPATLAPRARFSVDLIRDTATVDLVDQRIVAIELRHSDYRTADSIGVRTPLPKLLEVPGITGVTLDDRLYAVTDSVCGVRFEVMNPAPAPPAAQAGLEALTRLPGETRVRRLRIVGC